MRRASPLLFAFAACGTDVVPPSEITPPSPPQIDYLSPTEHLVRISMTLRQIRPSLDELSQVDANPNELPAIVDEYLESREFGRVMRDLHAETFLVRVDLPTFKFRPIGPIATTPVGAVNRSVWEEPLALIENVISSDLPYTNIVTAPFTVTDPISSVLWGTTYTGSGVEERTTYLDGRPQSGILSSSALFARHTAVGTNYHRSRANMISSTLLCFDYLHTDVVLDTSIDLSDPEVVSNAVVTNASCAGCHQSLDPMASFFFGYQPGARYATLPVPMWRTDDFYGTWQGTTGRPPSLNGKPGANLADLGTMLAADPRFPRCTAARFAGYFTQTDHARVARPWVARLSEAFVTSGFDAKQLARAIVLSDEFRVANAQETAPLELAETLHGLLRVRPEQLDAMIADLTGFEWSTTTADQMQGTPYGPTNLLRSDFLGFRAIAGGIDGYYATAPTHTTTAMSSLVQRTVAALAAGKVVDDDFAPGATPKLLHHATAQTIDEPSIRVQLAALHARIYGLLDASDGTAVTETFQLWAETHASTNDTHHAWKTTLTAMLGDLRVAYY